MKKILTILAVFLVLSLASCGNKDMIDTVYTYDYAYIQMPDGNVVQGKVENWRDYSDGDQIQVKINGNIYLVHSSKIVLIKNK